MRRLYLEAYATWGSKLNDRERFGPWRFISQSFILIRLWEVKKFKAHKLVLFGARMRFSGSKLKLSANDFYIPYLHLSDHHWTKSRQKIWSRVQIWEFILHFSNGISIQECYQEKSSMKLLDSVVFMNHDLLKLPNYQSKASWSLSNNIILY